MPKSKTYDMVSGPSCMRRRPELKTLPGQIRKKLADRLYDQKIMDNRERGSYAEEMVLQALLAVDPAWKWVGAGWNPWDFQKGNGVTRIRIQLRQSAARQLWRRRSKPVHAFSTEIKNKPSYFKRDHPGERIEKRGRFCEIFIFAWHRFSGEKTCDQRDPSQWVFYVVPEKSLGSKKRVRLADLEGPWLKQGGGQKTSWAELGGVVEHLISDHKKRGGRALAQTLPFRSVPASGLSLRLIHRTEADQ